MDAVDYLKTLRRICKEFNPMCPDCPAFPLCGASGDYIRFATPEEITKSVEDVEAWKEEHQAKTRQSEFLKIVPNAYADADGTVRIYPCAIDKKMWDEKCGNKGCTECRRKYWEEEIE